MKRVVITSAGVVSPIGLDTQSFWDSLVKGKHGFSKIQSFDTSDYQIKFAAEVQNWDPVAAGVPKKEARRMDRYTQFAMAAAHQLMQNAGDLESVDRSRFGVLIGSGIGGCWTLTDEHDRIKEKGPSRASVFCVPMMISNMASGQVAIAYGLMGDNYAPVSACATGGHAVGEAFRKIRHGYLDLAIAGGAEASIHPLAMAGFQNMGTLSLSEDPDRLSIPFDRERSGFVMGEGSGLLLLEEYEHAKRRGAHILAEIVGYGSTCDAYHITSPMPDGTGAARAMQNALDEAGIALQTVGYINAHGTSTPINDRLETLAIKRVFGEHAKKIAISSTKSVTGHMLGAAGSVEALVCAYALEKGVLPPTANYRESDPECDLDYITEGARQMPVQYALSNSFGFGGHNATLLLKRYEE